MKPAHEHDCADCVLVGQLTMPILGDSTKSITWDFYACQKALPKQMLIARHGPDKAYTVSMAPITQLASDTTRWPLNVGAQLVLASRCSTP